MEYCNSGTLENVISYISKIKNSNSLEDEYFQNEANTCYYMLQLNNAIHYLDKLGYVHRDI